MEIYRTPLSPMFIDKKFSEVANIIYTKLGAILVGVETSTTRQQQLRPGSFVKSKSSNAKGLVEFSQLLLATTDHVKWHPGFDWTD